MNAVVIVPDGVGVRNLVLGPFMHLISQQNEVCVLQVIPGELLPIYARGLNGRVHWEPLISYRESTVAAILRYALAYAQMYWCDTQSMRYMRSICVKESWRRRFLRRVSKLIGRASASPRGIRRLDRWHNARTRDLPQVAHYRRLFERVMPSVLFCSHQRPLEILPPVLAAREWAIPTACFIFSWDNLTSKGRIAAPFDYYLVWSKHMKEELLRYYPDVIADQVQVVGTPQFDPYADESLLWSREEFFSRIGGDLSRPLICYSGGDTTTCPEDPQHVKVLLELIRAGRIKNKPRVLLRPAPVDDGTRYDEIGREYPELLYAKPAWMHGQNGDWSRVIPLPEDIQFLANLTHHADLNINMASTMTLDFAIHDKPVVNIAFDVANQPPFGVPLWNFFYQFEHYRPVVELGAARFARSPEELARHVNTYLENPALDRKERGRLVELEVGVPLGQSSQRIYKVLEEIAL